MPRGFVPVAPLLSEEAMCYGVYGRVYQAQEER